MGREGGRPGRLRRWAVIQLVGFSGGGRDEGEGGLNSTGGVGGESGMDELPLELKGGPRRRLQLPGQRFSRPLVARVPAHEREHSHCGSKP
jgi:hypothetical protein